jgi:hypothetical protein
MGKEQAEQQDVVALASQCIADINVLDIDEWVERYLAPGFLWDTVPMGLEARTESREGFRTFFDDWTGAYSDWFLEIEEIVAVGEDAVVAAMRQGGRPHGSDQIVELRYGAISVWRDGICESTVNYSTFDDALAAGRGIEPGG